MVGVEQAVSVVLRRVARPGAAWRRSAGEVAAELRAAGGGAADIPLSRALRIVLSARPILPGRGGSAAGLDLAEMDLRALARSLDLRAQARSPAA